MTFDRVEKTENDPVYDAYFSKYASSPRELLRKYDHIFRYFGKIKCHKTYALDKERGIALLIVNNYMRIKSSRWPGACVIFMLEEMIVFNIANRYSRLKGGSFVEDVYEVMPFDPPLESVENEKIIEGLIVEGLTALGFDGTPYGESEGVGIRVEFNAKFDWSLF